MEVTISVDSTKLSGELSDVLKALSSDEKKAVCEKVITAWLNEPIFAERELAMKEVIADIRKKDTWLRDKDNEYIKGTTDFRLGMERFKSAKWDMVLAIQEEARKHYAEMVAEKVKTDPQLQQVMQGELDKIKENFGKYVHDAMIAWFCANMSKMADGIFVALQQSTQANDIVQRINQRV